MNSLARSNKNVFGRISFIPNITFLIKLIAHQVMTSSVVSTGAKTLIRRCSQWML